MTTIVFDGESLAVDNAGVNQGILVPVVKSWVMPNKHVVTGIGDGTQISIMAEWYKNGADPGTFPVSQRTGTPWCELIVATPEGLFRYERSHHPIHHGFNRCAFGSGKDFAYGALAMGANAAQAVHIASHFDRSTGMGVTLYRLYDEKPNETTPQDPGASQITKH